MCDLRAVGLVVVELVVGTSSRGRVVWKGISYTSNRENGTVL